MLSILHAMQMITSLLHSCKPMQSIYYFLPLDLGGHSPLAVRPHGNLLQPLLVAGCQDAVHLLRVHVDDLNTDGRRVVAELTGAVGRVEKLPFYIPPPSEELTAGRQQQQGSGERSVSGLG